MERKKIAVYGGSFNPPTMSHYEIMKMIIEEVTVDGEPLDEIWMVPCGDRVDKKISTSGEKRYVIRDYATLDLKCAKLEWRRSSEMMRDIRYAFISIFNFKIHLLINSIRKKFDYCIITDTWVIQIKQVINFILFLWIQSTSNILWIICQIKLDEYYIDRSDRD